MDAGNPIHLENENSVQGYQMKPLQNYRKHLIQSRKIEHYFKTWKKNEYYA